MDKQSLGGTQAGHRTAHPSTHLTRLWLCLVQPCGWLSVPCAVCGRWCPTSEGALPALPPGRQERRALLSGSRGCRHCRARGWSCRQEGGPGARRPAHNAGPTLLGVPGGTGAQGSRDLAAGRVLQVSLQGSVRDALGGFSSIKCSRLDLILFQGCCSMFFLYTCERICVNIRMMLGN